MEGQPLVVGYKGEIGSFILNGLLRVMPKALDIWCVDINESKSEIRERIRASNIIFLCVPILETINWLKTYKKLLKGKTIIEQCSLKEWVYDNAVAKGLNIKSMHILFRPSKTPNLEDRKVGFIAGHFSWTDINFIQKITESEVVLFKSIEEHDKSMATQQALAHRILLVLGEMLERNGGSTYISKRVLELTDRISKGDKELYQMIQDNKHLPAKLKQFKKCLNSFQLERFMEIKI